MYFLCANIFWVLLCSLFLPTAFLFLFDLPKISFSTCITTGVPVNAVNVVEARDGASEIDLDPSTKGVGDLLLNCLFFGTDCPSIDPGRS